jgi:hypothetical protein
MVKLEAMNEVKASQRISQLYLFSLFFRPAFLRSRLFAHPIDMLNRIPY